MLLPTGDVVIKDEFTTGEENYKEFFYTLVGLAGEGQNFDGNGQYVRFQTGGGTNTVSLGSRRRQHRRRSTATTSPCRSATGPRYPGKRPPYKPDRRCYKQTLPNLNGPAAPLDSAGRRRRARRQAQAAAAAQEAASVRHEVGDPLMGLAIRKHLRDAVAIVVLLVISLIVALVILSHQRLALPAGVPFLARTSSRSRPSSPRRRRSRRARARR